MAGKEHGKIDLQDAKAEGKPGARASRDLQAILRTFDFIPM